MGKYYIPKISEFHVGFEYEVMVPEGKFWSKEIFHLNKSHLDLIKYVDVQDEFTKNKIRVKYLDKEDIESSSFIQSSTSDKNVFIYSGENKQYPFVLRRLACNIIKIFSITLNDELVKPVREVQIFQGTINNKSELKKIIEMVGITK